MWEGMEAAWHARGWHCSCVDSLELPVPPAVGTVVAPSFSMLKDPLLVLDGLKLLPAWISLQTPPV